MKSKYWSCSKFADWLRGTSKIPTGTKEMWLAWENKAKIKKVRYWLAEEGLDYLQDFICWPANRLKDVNFYIRNRWLIKSHTLTSTLKRGEWHDLDSRLLHAVFDELVNFVEIEQAWMQVVFSEEDQKKYKTPWYRTIFCIGIWRSPAAGIAHLKWAADLKHDEDWVDKNDPDFGQSTSQALAAQEILILYKWWKEERPKRLDPSEASGWNAYCKEVHDAAIASGDEPSFMNLSKDKDDRSRDLLSISHKMEVEQEEEDTAMLIRLVKIRRSLWT